MITSKGEIKSLIQTFPAAYSAQHKDEFVKRLHAEILTQKIRFPMLEFFTRELLKRIPEEEQIPFAEKVMQLNETGSNVVAGIVLQERLASHYEESLDKACDFIVYGNEWYVCDIIGERVIGVALLNLPEKTIPVLQKLSRKEDKWLVRTIGVASHYAIKKGLKKKYVQQLFELLLSLSNTTDFHTKKGIGWAAKTTAKFYPDIIKLYEKKIESSEVKQWFKTKINIGLGRSGKYASRYSG